MIGVVIVFCPAQAEVCPIRVKLRVFRHEEHEEI